MKQRVALVTGGGRGIGREAALLLSAAGARVMVAARSAAELAAVGLEYVAADLGTPEGCALAVAETEQERASARFETMNSLVSFLTENCCQDSLAGCGPAVICKPKGTRNEAVSRARRR